MKKSHTPIILGIESSCDETSASICRYGKIASNVTAGQTVHNKYGGVVPELASRMHQRDIIPTIDNAIADAKVNKKDINAVAFTLGPGLMGSLLVGAAFAKAFAMALNIPIIAVHHMQAHILAHFIQAPYPPFPFLCLTVSGGHTQIVLVKDYLDMEVLGQTIDDAAGEAFDKAAKIIGLEYPGGPLIDKLAKTGDGDAFEFPRPNIPGLDFSFSGLKTSFLYFIKKHTEKQDSFIANNLHDLCASIQKSIVSILFEKVKKASDITGIKNIAIAGGVAANSCIRNCFLQAETTMGWDVYIPEFDYCTDNAAMVAIAGNYKYLRGDFSKQDISPLARWSI